MKAVRCNVKSRASYTRVKAQHRAHADYMYKLHRQVEPVQSSLVNEARLAPSFLLWRLGVEAARLSALNRRRIITSWELSAAMKRLSQRRNAAPMAGA